MELVKKLKSKHYIQNRLILGKRISIMLLSISLLTSGLMGTSTVSYALDNTGAKELSIPIETVLSPSYDKMKGLFGFKDATGKWVIEPKYINAGSYSEGLAPVTIDDEFYHSGYIDDKGNLVIKAEYNQCLEFRNGKAVVSKDGKAYVIDKTGKVLTKTDYYLSAGDSKNYLALIMDKSMSDVTDLREVKYGIINNNGDVIKPQFLGTGQSLYGFTIFYKTDYPDDIYSVETWILTNSGKVVPIKGMVISASEGIALYQYSVEVGKGTARSNAEVRYGYVTSDGRIIDSYKSTDGSVNEFVKAKPFSEGMAVVAINKNELKHEWNDRWGIIKADGTWLREPVGYEVGSFSEGIAPVKNYNLIGFIDKSNNWVIEPYLLEKGAVVDEKYKGISYLNSLTEYEYEYSIKETEKILNSIIKPSMTERQKFDAIYGYITKNVRYDFENFYDENVPRSSFSIYGPLRYNVAVCSGYAQTLDFLLKNVGIESQIITGVVNRDGVGHAWNLVKIDGIYYHMDSTWDEGMKSNQWKYYFRDDDYMREGRTWNESNYPKATKDNNPNDIKLK